MKLFNKLFMMALVLSVFAGCGKDDDPPKDDKLPIADVAGTYKGTIEVGGHGLLAGIVDTTIANVPINIAYNAGDSVTLSVTLNLAAGTIPITAKCAVTSTESNYSLSGNVSVPNVPAVGTVAVTISNSTIDKAGHAVFNMTGAVSGVSLLTIGFDGQKQ